MQSLSASCMEHRRRIFCRLGCSGHRDRDREQRQCGPSLRSDRPPPLLSLMSQPPAYRTAEVHPHPPRPLSLVRVEVSRRQCLWRPSANGAAVGERRETDGHSSALLSLSLSQSAAVRWLLTCRVDMRNEGGGRVVGVRCGWMMAVWIVAIRFDSIRISG